ncbi:MAG: beta-lactamase family protein, partial [Chitinophagaceae bacterium]|nr:beta-lactamase family protein [Chitinophagaceae bacterium]
FMFLVQFIYGQNKVQKIDSLMNVLFSTHDFNGNVLVAEKGEILYSQSFGFANETTKEKLTVNSVFETGSVSKQFTAMAIMILMENGKLNLDHEIKRYIPEVSNYNGITIRNLLNHTSGLPDYMNVMDSLFDKSKIATNKDLVAIFSNYKPKVLFEPNDKFEYSNTGYALLATIIENVSGLTYADYLHQFIFKPLKMKNTFVYNRRLNPKKIANYALGYISPDSLTGYILPDNFEETKFVIWLDGIVGDGTVNSTVTDLLKWDRALCKNKLLSEEGMKAIFEVGTLNNKTKTSYAKGWEIEKFDIYSKMTRHGGSWPGYVAYIERHVENDKTIIILQNHEDDISIPLKAIRKIIYNKQL